MSTQEYRARHAECTTQPKPLQSGPSMEAVPIIPVRIRNIDDIA